MKRYVIVATVVLAVAATAPGVLRATTRRAGGPPPVQAFLDSKLRELPQLTSVNLGAPKPNYPGTQYMYVTATATNTASMIKAEWEAGLLAGALADSGLTVVDGFLVTVSDPSGNVMEENGTEIPAGSLVSSPVSTEAALAKKLPGALFLHVDQLEAIIHRRTSNPRGFAADFRNGISNIVGDDQGYDGRLVQVDDRTGKPVVVQASVNRLNWRMTWVNPAYGPNPAFSPTK
jgi:hypothetical protein